MRYRGYRRLTPRFLPISLNSWTGSLAAGLNSWTNCTSEPLNRRLRPFTALNSWTGGLSIGSNSWKHCISIVDNPDSLEFSWRARTDCQSKAPVSGHRFYSRTQPLPSENFCDEPVDHTSRDPKLGARRNHKFLSHFRLFSQGANHRLTR
jgi:hypothetical protein